MTESMEVDRAPATESKVDAKENGKAPEPPSKLGPLKGKLCVQYCLSHEPSAAASDPWLENIWDALKACM